MKTRFANVVIIHRSAPSLSRLDRGRLRRQPLGSQVLISRERDGDAGGFSAGVTFPVVADFDALDEFRRRGRDHPVAAVWAAHLRGERANGGNIRRVAMRLHDLDLFFQGRLTLAANTEVTTFIMLC